MRPVPIFVLPYLLLTAGIGTSHAQTPGTFTLQEENDLLAFNDRADRGYTNGTRLTWTWSPLESSWADRLVGTICGDAEDCRRSATLGLGQSMYTPENLESRRTIRGDRPYGGWLYGVLMLDAVKEETADHLEVYAGIVGPSARAEEAQTFIHQEITPSAPDPLGWDTQIGDRAGFLMTYERRQSFLELQDRNDLPFLDLTPTLGGALGNVFDYLAAGATLRIGYNLPPRFHRSIPSFAPETSNTDVSEVPRWDAFLFATAEARYVAHNLFLDAENESYRIRREPVVRDRRIGATVRVRGVRIEYSHTFRSPEFEPDPRSHSFGTLSLIFGTQP